MGFSDALDFGLTECIPLIQDEKSGLGRIQRNPGILFIIDFDSQACIFGKKMFKSCDIMD
jgi:hypothetical protein